MTMMVYYHDEQEDLYIGTVTLNPKNDCFDMLKKLLTLLLSRKHSMKENFQFMAMVEIVNDGC